MRIKLAGFLFVTFITLVGCSKEGAAPAGGQQATVTLKDGSTFSGAVTKNSNEAITLQAVGGETRTYPMTQVAGVQYADAAAAPVAAVPVPDNTAPRMASANATSSPRPTPAPRPTSTSAVPVVAPFTTRTIAAGTTIQVRNNEAIDSATARAGQTFSAVVASDILDQDGNIAVPKGSDATLVVKSVTDQGKVQGQSDLVVDLDSVEVGGRKYLVDTNNIVERGKQGVGTNKRTGLFTGGGAVLGTVIGAVAGGGKGAAIGAASGAAAGAGAQTLTRGKAVRIPSETILNFRLETAANIREAR